MDERRSLAAVFAVIGVLAIIGGAYYVYNQISFLNRCEKARGTVVDLLWEAVTDEEGTVDYSCPIIEFKDTKGAGALISAQGRVRSNPPGYKIGDVVDVLYDPRGPKYVF